MFVCLFCLFSFAKPGILSLYGFDSGLHLSGFLRIVFSVFALSKFCPADYAEELDVSLPESAGLS